MAGAVSTQGTILHGLLAPRCLEQAEHVEIVTRHALAPVTQLPSAVIPGAQPMQNHDFAQYVRCGSTVVMPVTCRSMAGRSSAANGLTLVKT